MSDAPPPLLLTVGPPDPADVDAELIDGPADDEHQADELGPAELVTEEQVRRVLVTIGTSAGQWIGDADVPDHWSFTAAELDALTPPLTAYVNRSPRLRGAVHKSDALTIAAVLFGYGWRNVDDGRRAARARQLDGTEVPTFDGLHNEAPMDPRPAGADAPVVDLFGGPAPTATGPGGFAPDRPAGLDG